MTIVVAYRRGQDAAIINDFRVTYNEKLMDAMMKFTTFDDRMSLFLAGSVSVWQNLIPKIRQIEGQITIGNLLDLDGPLYDCVLWHSLSQHETPGQTFGAIGFLIDSQSGRNHLFKIVGKTGQYPEIVEIQDRECVVIGSGSSIPSVASTLKSNADRVLFWHPNEGMAYIGNAMGQALKGIIKNTGSSTYKKLGISPIFAYSILEGTAFLMLGMRTEGDAFTSDFSLNTPMVSYHYDWSFVRKNDIIHLLDHQNNQCVPVCGIMEYSTSNSSEQVFDPEKQTTCFDPSSHANPNDVVYIIDQWVIDEQTVTRVIDKTSLVTPYQEKPEIKICDPRYYRVAMAQCTSSVGVYQRSGRHYLLVAEHLQSEFEKNVQTKMFDHDWMVQFISNYNDLWINN